MKLFKSLVAMAAVGAASLSAQASVYNVLTFDPVTACGTTACSVQPDGTASFIVQGYGDNVSAGVNVGSGWYDEGSTIPDQSLRYWDTGYSTLQNVAWGGDINGVLDTTAYVYIESNANETVALSSFDIALYDNPAVAGWWKIVDMNMNILDSGSFNNSTFSSGVAHITSSASSLGGVALMWSASTGTVNVAVDNIAYQVSGVPEPETYAMLLAGLGAIGAVRRRRRQAK